MFSGDKNETARALQVLLREFIPAFEKILLSQPSTKCVQYILFYLLSRKNSFPDSFIDWLLKVAIKYFCLRCFLYMTCCMVFLDKRSGDPQSAYISQNFMKSVISVRKHMPFTLPSCCMH